jgi:outer membrane protein OmpA-like peptidoglycan-associated protein
MSQCNCGCAKCAANASELWNEWGGAETFEYLQEAPSRPGSRPIPRRTRVQAGVAATPMSTAPMGCQHPIVLDGFGHESYRLEMPHLAALAELISRLHANPPSQGSVLRIRGHTDNTGSTRVNQGLGFARALEVKVFMATALEKIQVALRLSPSSPGANEPVAPNTTEAGRRQNRRVEILLCPASPTAAPLVPAPAAEPATVSGAYSPPPPPIEYPPTPVYAPPTIGVLPYPRRPRPRPRPPVRRMPLRRR